MDEIAICGVSARIAKCQNVEEFAKGLLNAEDLVTHDHKRWNCDYLKTPKAIGVLPGLDNFDAQFFGVNLKQADHLDPRTRQLLEVVFESFMDAGCNPQDLRGTNTAVILAVAENSNEGLMDRSLAIMANTISYYLDLHGPSYAIDTGCSSSVYALNQAVEALSFGSCDNAVVCSAQTHLLPTDSVQLNRLGVLSKEGKCKTFDDDRDGYVKSEGVVSIFLQKRHKARRIYATIAGIGCNADGFKKEGMSNPSSQSQLNLLRRIYEKFQINPKDVEYLDAHGTGTLIGDIKECAALSGFFASRPLKIGSVKTNTGHCENAAGLVSLVKLIIAINTGVIPANIHFENAALDIPSIDNQKLEVLRSNTQYTGGLLALNSFGIGGANGHVVIRPFLNNPASCTGLEKPRLTLVSGRTEQSVKKLLDAIEENKNNQDFLTLLDNIFQHPIKNYSYKGFTTASKNNQEIRKTNGQKPIWFSYSGMGSQWPGMAKHFMHFTVFRDTVEKGSNALQAYGINLMDVLLNGDEETFMDPEKCFPAIIAVSVGLTDILHSLGVRAEGIIGHSLGEIGCAYGDGLITSEQAILMAHARGLATKRTKLIAGLMASVGITFEECEHMLPGDIYVACHNYQHNVTISGPKESVERFVNDLQSKGVFARIVNTAGIAFHSKYVHDAGPILLDMLRKIIPVPRRRSGKWIPSAIPQCDHDSFLGEFNSAEYHYENFMNRVHYKQVLDMVPDEAVLLEIAPRGLFQAIFRRALSKSVVKLYLADKDVTDNVEFFISTIGKLYLSTNISLNLQTINNFSSLPVAGKTPFISPMVKWDHSSKWHVPKYVHCRHDGGKIVFNLRSLEFKFLYGQIINENAVLPISGFLFLAWKAFANKHEKELHECSVALQNVQLIKSVKLKDVLEFHVNILQSGDFEIMENDCLVAKGNISWQNESDDQNLEGFYDSGGPVIDSEDIYKEFLLRGYVYSNSFKGIQRLNVSGRYGSIIWANNWISFMDSIVQAILLHEHSALAIPNELLHVTINPVTHQNVVMQKKDLLEYHYDNVMKTATCGGIRVTGLATTRIKQKSRLELPILNRYKFIPNELAYVRQNLTHLEFSLSVALQIVIENNIMSSKTCIATMEGIEGNLQESIILSLINKRHLKNVKFALVKDVSEASSNIHLLICSLEQNLTPAELFIAIGTQIFVFCKVSNAAIDGLGDNVVFRCSKEDASYVLLRKHGKIPEKFEVINTSTKDFTWVKQLKENLNKVDQKTYLVSYSLTTGLTGFFNCLKEELQTNNLRVFIVKNEINIQFNPNSDFWRSQVKKDLAINIFENNRWCTYRSLPLNSYVIEKIKNVKRKLCFDRNKSYIVVGGLGGVGLELIKWLIKKGATKIIINSRSSTASGYARFLIDQWIREGKTILTQTCDARTIEGATTLFEEATKVAPVDGIFNLAMVLKDQLILDLTPDDFLEVVAPKLHISQNLDQLSQKWCPGLRYFVAFSAMTVLGNQSQSNYGFANSSVETLCLERRSKGFPALAVQWGCIGDVGYVSRQNFKKKLLRENPQSIRSCLKTLKELLLQKVDVVSSAIYETTEETLADASSKVGILDVLVLILGAKSPSDLDRNIALVDMGIDSISLVEIKNLIREECEIEVSSSQIRKMTLAQIEELKITS